MPARKLVGRSMAEALLKGVLAGTFATVAMDRVTSYMWARENRKAREDYERVTGGKYVPNRSAERVKQLLGLHLSQEQENRLASAMHWGLGLGAAATYALMRRTHPRATLGRGLLFGTVFWALIDESATVLLGLAEPPREYPWQAHARGLAGHLVYGVAADTTINLLDRVA